MGDLRKRIFIFSNQGFGDLDFLRRKVFGKRGIRRFSKQVGDIRIVIVERLGNFRQVLQSENIRVDILDNLMTKQLSTRNGVGGMLAFRIQKGADNKKKYLF